MSHADLVKEMDKLRGFALRLSDQPTDADDLLQASLLKAMEKKHMFRPGSNLFAWCSKIMYNTFVSGYRRRRNHESQYDPGPIIAAQASPDRSFDHLRCAEMNDILQTLSPIHQLVIKGVCVEGRPYQEVADSLEIPVGTVRSRLSRARQELEQHLQESSTKD